MRRFAAIDFETANRDMASICSVGVVFVEDGQIVDKYYNLIRPSPNYYFRVNTSVHGLKKEDTEDAPVFPTVWREVAMLIKGMPLVAHNSGFDRTCLKAAHVRYEMDYPDYQFYCTYQLGRKYFKELPNHKLPTVSAHCGFDLKTHHHALADAEACAVIMNKILSMDFMEMSE